MASPARKIHSRVLKPIRSPPFGIVGQGLWLISISILVAWLLVALISKSVHAGMQLLSLFPNQANTAVPEFGFIMTRCVRTSTHNELWRENYRCLRQHFPMAPILIIDDYSDLTLVDQNFAMTNAAILYSDLPPGKGEILPYYYFYHRRPFRKAVMLNDGMLLQRREPLRSAIQETSDFKYLWHFDGFRENELEEQLYLISALKPEVQDRLRDLRVDLSNWTGCFSSASIMTWDFLDRIHRSYGLLNMVPVIQTRAHRMGLERLMGLITADAVGLGLPSKEALSVFGSILGHRKTGFYNWQDYVQDKASGSIAEPMIKIWNGRR